MNSFLVRTLIPMRNVTMFHNSVKPKTDIFYTQSHETIQIENDEVKVGISDYARKELGDIVFIEADVEIEEEIECGDTIVTVESVKATSEIFTPSGGKVIEHNEDLIENINELDNVNEKDFWFVKYKTETSETLKTQHMNKDDYLDFLKND